MLNTNSSIELKLTDRNVKLNAHFDYKTDRSVIQTVKRHRTFMIYKLLKLN